MANYWFNSRVTLIRFYEIGSRCYNFIKQFLISWLGEYCLTSHQKFFHFSEWDNFTSHLSKKKLWLFNWKFCSIHSISCLEKFCKTIVLITILQNLLQNIYNGYGHILNLNWFVNFPLSYCPLKIWMGNFVLSKYQKSFIRTLHIQVNSINSNRKMCILLTRVGLQNFLGNYGPLGIIVWSNSSILFIKSIYIKKTYN